MGARGPERIALLAAALLSIASGATAWSKEPASAPNEALVELGQRLFFDPVVSPSRTRSCADCHDPEHGWSDPEPRSLDVRGRTERHAQTLVDCGDAKSFHWEGELSSIADVVRERQREGEDPYARLRTRCDPPASGGGCVLPGDPPPLAAPAGKDAPLDGPGPLVSPGFDLACVRAPDSVLNLPPSYRELVSAVDVAGSKAATVPDAIAEFVRTIRSGTSPYDRFAAGDAKALSPGARRGLELFRGRAGCAGCHLMEGRRAEFLDHERHEFPLRFAPPPAEPPPRARDLPLECEPPPATVRRFKTPTLRDVARRGPYLHDGSEETLEGAVRRFVPPDLLEAPDAEAHVADLVAFLRALTSDERPGPPARPCRWRAKTTRVRLLDDAGEPLSRFSFQVVSAGEPLGAPRHPRAKPLVTDAEGYATYEPPPWTHARIVVGDGAGPVDGPLLPDTCRKATLYVRIRGTGRVEVRFPRGAAPPALRARHVEAPLRPGGYLPATTFRRERTRLEGEHETATYAAPRRMDVGHVSELELPAGYEPVRVALGGAAFVAWAVARPVASPASR